MDVSSEQTSAEIANDVFRLSDEQVGGIQTFEDALKAVEAEAVSFTIAGDFDLISDKRELVGVPFAILRWRFTNKEGMEFVSVEAICQGKDGAADRRVVFNDGGTGIFKQLEAVTTSTGKQAGGICKRGLRVSDYTFIDDKGIERPASTYYLT